MKNCQLGDSAWQFLETYDITIYESMTMVGMEGGS